MKKLLILLSFFTFNMFGHEVAQFDAYKANSGNDDTVMAIIDKSQLSLDWLQQNSKYLIDKQVPVLALDTSQQQADQLNNKYPGLLVGIVPEPKQMLDVLLNQLGVKYYPSVIENGVIWQVNPNEK